MIIPTRSLKCHGAFSSSTSSAAPGGTWSDRLAPHFGHVLRPGAFRANAIDVAGLYDHVVEAAPRYSGIAAPTVVISGNRDTVVYEEIHSEGLARDIPGAELVWVDNLGHKPDWIAPDLIVAAIEKVAGKPVERCPDPKPPLAQPAQ